MILSEDTNSSRSTLYTSKKIHIFLFKNFAFTVAVLLCWIGNQATKILGISNPSLFDYKLDEIIFKVLQVRQK